MAMQQSKTSPSMPKALPRERLDSEDACPRPCKSARTSISSGGGNVTTECTPGVDDASATAGAAEVSSSTEAAVHEVHMRTQVQALLVGVDLQTVTVGQLRGQLEERMGLAAGTLSSKKRLRRQVSWVVQQEVMKKSQRSSDCERIVKALIEFEEYPRCVRQMLIDSLPQAVTFDDQIEGEDAASREAGRCRPHEHQVRLLEIVRDALKDSQAKVEAKSAAAAAVARAAEEVLLQAEVAKEAADATEGEAQKVVESDAAMHAAAEQEVRQAEEELIQAEEFLKSLQEQRGKFAQEREMFKVVSETQLQTLLEGTWSDAKTKDCAIGSIQLYLKDLGVESALVDAVPLALSRLPSERGMFDAVTAKSVQKVFADKIVQLDMKLDPGAQAQAETGKLAADALVTAAKDRAAELGTRLEQSRATAAEAAAACSLAAASTSECQRAVDESGTVEAQLARRLQELCDTVAIVDRLIAGDAPATQIEPMQELEAECPVGSLVEPHAAPPTEVTEPPSNVESNVEDETGACVSTRVPADEETQKAPSTDESCNSSADGECSHALKFSPDRKAVEMQDEAGSARRREWPPPTPQRKSIGGTGCGHTSPMEICSLVHDVADPAAVE